MTAEPPVIRPSVARTSKRSFAWPAAIGLLLLGSGVFAKLVTGRTALAEQGSGLPALSVARADPLPTVVAPAAAAPASPAPVIANSPVLLTASPGSALAPQPALLVRPAGDAGADQRRARLAAPSLIIDLVQGRIPDAARSDAALQIAGSGAAGAPFSGSSGPAVDGVSATAAIGGAAAVNDAPEDRSLTGNERFAARAGGREVDVSQAQRLPNLDRLVPQGAIIGAVLETALNTDLPGFARGLVSRDVLSFDGSAVLIPAGSRIIGEYNSGVAQGASRIFIVWTRLIRPDGVSIALASPAVDDLGRGGLKGKVNRHFLQRFGGAILLSVLTGGIQAATTALGNGSTILVGSSGEATALAGQALRGTDIPPTIKTRQGASVRIFVARDLDFSAVGPAR